MTFPQTPSIPAEHPCLNHDNVQRRLHPFPQSIHVATMITFPQTLSSPTEYPCGNHDNFPTNSIHSHRASMFHPWIFGIPRSQLCRTGRAKLNLSMRKNQHESAFSLLATLVKRVKTDRRPKNFLFSKPFFATKTTVFCTPTCPKPTRKPFLHTYTRRSKIAFSKKGPITPHPRQVQLCRWEQRFRGPNPKKTWDPLRRRDLVGVVVLVAVVPVLAVATPFLLLS